MHFSDGVLLESRSARDEQLMVISDNQAERYLNKVKSVFFGVWQGTGYLTIQKTAEFYEVSQDSLDKNYQRNSDEFLSDGARVAKGADLKDVRDIMSLTSKRPSAILLPPRAVMRMGFILRDSQVAKQVRTAALNAIEYIPRLIRDREELSKIISGCPATQALVKYSQKSMLFEYYDAVLPQLRQIPHGIPGMKENGFRDRLALLSTYTDNWCLRTEKEFCYRLGSTVKTRYPDLISQVFTRLVRGQAKRVAFVFECKDPIVEESHIYESVYGRQYLQLVQEQEQVDYVFLFLVAPFGLTPRADEYLSTLPEDLKELVGVISVKQLAEFLLTEAYQSRTNCRKKGEIRRSFSDILKYPVPEVLPLFASQQLTLDQVLLAS